METRRGEGRERKEMESSMSWEAGSGEESDRTMSSVEVWLEETMLLTQWMSLEVVAVMLACCIHRQHLFVWTVFSPKYLYMGAWVVCWHLAVNVVAAGILAWMD